MAEHPEKPIGSPAGRWYLVAAEYPEGEIPHHRVDLVFHDEPAGLRGAILSRRDGSELPLTAVTFSGGGLRFRMSVPPVGE